VTAILLFILIIFVLVLVHELGHFIVAKWCGMRVDEFGIGFPPKLFGKRFGETEYSFNALPIGGFVRIHGEDLGEVRDDALRAFSSKPKWMQALVLVAGVAMNVLLAWALFSAAYVGGIETAVDPAAAGPDAELAILGVLPESPAARAGIEPNDRVVALQSEAIGETLAVDLTPERVAAFIEESGGAPLTVTYLRAGEEMTTTLATSDDVPVEGEPDRARIGVIMGMIEHVEYSIPAAIGAGFMDTVHGLYAIVVGVSTLLANAVMGNADFSQVAGPVGIAGLAGDASQFGLSAVLILAAFISLNLAIINLLPFPALDGGRLVMVGIEAVRRKPIRASTARAVNTFGFLFLILLMVLVTWQDILRL
jgi:regulator of sigma E protease